MRCYEIMERAYANKGEQPLSKAQLESMGFDVDISFKDAIELTDPKKLVFESSSMKLPDNGGSPVKAVKVVTTYGPVAIFV